MWEDASNWENGGFDWFNKQYNAEPFNMTALEPPSYPSPDPMETYRFAQQGRVADTMNAPPPTESSWLTDALKTVSPFLMKGAANYLSQPEQKKQEGYYSADPASYQRSLASYQALKQLMDQYAASPAADPNVIAQMSQRLNDIQASFGQTPEEMQLRQMLNATKDASLSQYLLPETVASYEDAINRLEGIKSGVGMKDVMAASPGYRGQDAERIYSEMLSKRTDIDNQIIAQQLALAQARQAAADQQRTTGLAASKSLYDIFGPQAMAKGTLETGMAANTPFQLELAKLKDEIDMQRQLAAGEGALKYATGIPGKEAEPASWLNQTLASILGGMAEGQVANNQNPAGTTPQTAPQSNLDLSKLIGSIVSGIGGLFK